MMKNNKYIEYQTHNLVRSTLLNITNSFLSISFDVLQNGCIHIRCILEEYTKIEKDYIDDMSGEFEASQSSAEAVLNILEKIEIVTDKDVKPLRYLIYSRIS